MKIERINKGEWGKVRAFFDVQTEEGFIIKGFKIIEGINGLFVSMPSQKGKEEEYFDTIWIESKQLRDELTELAINSYQSNSSETLKPNTETGEKVPEETDEIPAEELSTQDKQNDIVQPFSEDDIPF